MPPDGGGVTSGGWTWMAQSASSQTPPQGGPVPPGQEPYQRPKRRRDVPPVGTSPQTRVTGSFDVTINDIPSSDSFVLPPRGAVGRSSPWGTPAAPVPAGNTGPSASSSPKPTRRSGAADLDPGSRDSRGSWPPVWPPQPAQPAWGTVMAGPDTEPRKAGPGAELAERQRTAASWGTAPENSNVARQLEPRWGALGLPGSGKADQQDDATTRTVERERKEEIRTAQHYGGDRHVERSLDDTTEQRQMPPGFPGPDRQRIGSPPWGERTEVREQPRTGQAENWQRTGADDRTRGLRPADGARTGDLTQTGDPTRTGEHPTTERRSPNRRTKETWWSQTWARVQVALGLTPTDVEVWMWWMLSRLGIFFIAVTAPWLFHTSDAEPLPGFLDRWKQWDFHHYDRIAIYGYFDPDWDVPLEAFFPGLPGLLGLGALFGIPTVLVGLLISMIGGGVAAVALARLADAEWGEGAGRRAAVMWMVAPPAIFLAAPYTESLFLALAIPAWLAARRGRWATAGTLAAAASLVRVSGLFLAIALVVEFLTSPKGRDWARGSWLLAPLVPLFGYMTYLKVNTGDWLAWYHAQAQGWYRDFTPPWLSFIHTVEAATGRADFGGDITEAWRINFEWMFRAELVAMLVGVVVTVVLLCLRRWGEATWVGIQVVAFSTSYWFFSVPRAALLWFPLWMGLAAISLRKRWVWLTYLLISVPLFGVWAAAYLTGKWAG